MRLVMEEALVNVLRVGARSVQDVKQKQLRDHISGMTIDGLLNTLIQIPALIG